MSEITAAQETPSIVGGGNIREPAKPFPTWIRVTSFIIPIIAVVIAVNNLIAEFRSIAGHTAYQVTATGYTISTPGTLHALVTFAINYLAVVVSLSLFITGGLNRRRTQILSGGLFLLIPFTLVGGFILAAVAQQSVMPNRIDVYDWLRNNYQVQNIDLPSKTSTFYAVSNSGIKYKFKYANIPDGFSVKELPITGDR